MAIFARLGVALREVLLRLFKLIEFVIFNHVIIYMYVYDKFLYY